KKCSRPPHDRDLMTSDFSQHASTPRSTIVDIHTHLLSLFALYRSKDPEGEYKTASDFFKGIHEGVETLVDV
ncbi:hypothetical protein F5146DRAFT_919674, partial [Armillaria mellea]